MDTAPIEPWRTLARREIARSDPWVRLWAEDVQLPDGRVVQGFSTIDMPDHAVVVALTPDGEVVISRNYKHGPRRVCINLPAGYLEPGEEPLAAAQRELLEETGYTADNWLPLGSFFEDGNRGCGRAFLFLARGARQVAEPDSDDLEELTVELMPLAELLQAARRGDVAVLAIAAAMGLAMAALQGGWDELPTGAAP